ncbi:DUF4179 domain-containing protein [Paenibacillus sp. N3.4]|uniref:DUF4179 domain-containing protein n=1 Tax=Paenibacillus sp. N3.4 TaxID=2603222 RepID=UPI0011C8D23C|nr:DUF4179 domain-containing protein [Paenibacillus sp. N3.4]TXK85057.1 DUF4179 domain-containing protein [Paenibacillus sp. N3.4]
MFNPDDEHMEAELAEKLDVAIRGGIRIGSAKLEFRRKQVRRRLGGVIAACMLLFASLLTIKVSPVFAAIVRDIPGLEKFVDLIQHTADKGIKLALDNEFVQAVDVSDEHEGINFTVQGIIADDSRMVVFYDIRSRNKSDKPIRLDGPRLIDRSGHVLPASVSFSNQEEEKSNIGETGIQRGTADFQLSQGTSWPDEVVFRMQLYSPELAGDSRTINEMIRDVGEKSQSGAVNVKGTEFNLTIPIDRARFAGLQHEYIMDQTIHIEGQSVAFAKAIVSPLRISLYMDYGKDNSKQIFGAGDIKLVDDKGNVWRNTSASLMKDHPVYHFESPFFNMPKSLTIEGSWFRALDKNQLTVQIDTLGMRVLQAPDGKLKLYNGTQSEKYTKLDFTLNGLEQTDTMMYNLFDEEFIDAAGKRYKTADLHQIISSYIDNSKSGEQHGMYYIDNEAYKQPLTLTLIDYPAYIKQPYKIRIK